MLSLIFAFVIVLVSGWLLIRGIFFLLKYSEQWINHARPKVFPRPRECPRCEQPIGRFERLNSVRELLLGGWTCPKCGSEFDQLDNIRIARAWNAHLRDLSKRSRRADIDRGRKDGRTPVERLIDE